MADCGGTVRTYHFLTSRRRRAEYTHKFWVAKQFLQGVYPSHWFMEILAAGHVLVFDLPGND